MAFSPGDAAMPVYLLIASIFNSIFFYRSIKDVRSKEIAVSGAPSIALLLTAISEFVWVLPCFIQCFLVFVLGHDGDWAPEREASGCDVQGFYSQLGSVSGMLSTLVLALLTLRIARSQRMPSTSQMLVISGAVFALSLLVSVLPFMGAGNYSYSGEGFCYIDWYDNTSSAIMLTIVIPTFLAVISIGICSTVRLVSLPSPVRRTDYKHLATLPMCVSMLRTLQCC
uniref:G-protein coupled receptors family 1 profile domain-containing protein n=1 Tax=Chrysotila carterae TaxID=13221 RepID=A0A7S4EWJ4_CHRCT